MSPRQLLVSAFLLLGFPARGAAWSAVTHRAIAMAAAARLPDGSRQEARRFQVALELGAAAPDRRYPGWIPPRAHVLHPETDLTGGSAAEAVEGLVEWLVRTQPRDHRWWFHAGRLSHLLADLRQPLHSHGVPEERRYHASYERWAAGLPVVPGAGEARRDREAALPDAARLLVTARATRRLYEPLMEQLSGGGRETMAKPTQIWVADAIEDTRSAWVALLDDEGGGPAGAWAWARTVLLWFLLLGRRRRLGEGS